MFNFIFDGRIGEILAPVVPSNQLFLAIQHHRNSEVSSLLPTYQLNRISEGGYAAIHVACRYNNKYALDLILQNGITLEFLDQTGNTPLHYASKYGHLDLCMYLIDKGSNAAILNSKKQSPYDVAESHLVRQYLLPLFLSAERNAQLTEPQAANYSMGTNYTNDYIYPTNIAPPPTLPLSSVPQNPQSQSLQTMPSHTSSMYTPYTHASSTVVNRPTATTGPSRIIMPGTLPYLSLSLLFISFLADQSSN